MDTRKPSWPPSDRDLGHETMLTGLVVVVFAVALVAIASLVAVPFLLDLTEPLR